MAAILTTTTTGRIGNITSLSAITVTVNANSTAYATASGGLPIDLAAILNTTLPADVVPHPSDVIGMTFTAMSTNGYMPSGLVIGTPTYTSVPGASTQGAGLGTLATCPATIRLLGTGASAGAKFNEVADGANTDTFTGLLLIARGGHNQ